MRVNNYRKIDKKDLIDKIEATKASFLLLNDIHKRGYLTLNDYIKTKHNNKNFTLANCTKILKDFDGLGLELKLNRDEWSHKHSFKTEFEFTLKGNRVNVLKFSLEFNEDGIKVDRHAIYNSMWIDSHTIIDLMNNASTSIKDYERVLNVYDSIDESIQKYTDAIENCIEQAYREHISSIDCAVTSYSY